LNGNPNEADEADLDPNPLPVAGEADLEFCVLTVLEEELLKFSLVPST
jgi:hypothetical protein